MECLPVYIDFLPAIELLFYNPMGNDALEHRFLVPNRCKQCMIYPRTWRISMCREEVKTMSQMSETHRQSYQILKFLLPSQYSTSYHLKTAVLNHSLSCSANSAENRVKCVIAVLHQLQHAYKYRYLPSFGLRENLLPGIGPDESKIPKYIKQISILLRKLENFNSWPKLRRDLDFDSPWPVLFPEL